jgi:predicted RNA-binding Zn-ribbon protein involved in translation (DUF1610 family)
MQTVILKTFDNYFSANITLTRLQDTGINCFLVDEYTVTIDPILSNAIGGIKLAIDTNDAQIAASMLAKFDEEYMKAAVCPTCGKHEIISVPKQGAGNFLTAILTWLFSSYAVAGENVYQCQNCGYESKTLPENTAQYN